MNDSSLRDSYANAIQYHKKNNFKKAEEIYLQLLKIFCLLSATLNYY